MQHNVQLLAEMSPLIFHASGTHRNSRTKWYQVRTRRQWVGYTFENV